MNTKYTIKKYLKDDQHLIKMNLTRILIPCNKNTINLV